TNTNLISSPARPGSASSRNAAFSAPIANGFKVPYLPRPETPVDQRPRTPGTPIPSTMNRLRRWSSVQHTQSPRRNSFPSSRKDGLEYLRALRAEAKLAREKGVSASMANGTPTPTRVLKTPHTSTVTQTPGVVQTPGVDSGYFNMKMNSPDV